MTARAPGSPGIARGPVQRGDGDAARVSELFFGPTFSPAGASPAAFLESLERLRALA